MQHHNFDQAELRVALARAGKTRVQLAAELKMSYSTLSGWATGRYRAPKDFRRKVEQRLGLKNGTLRPKSKNVMNRR